ncbi:MAG TPA: TMEM175 family protein [Candidatus Binatus sp.]|nr:TMEM175 family protein [Candidatus Binatus sp.]
MGFTEREEVNGLGKNRVEGLTDGIFGTVMTILVLSLPVLSISDLGPLDAPGIDVYGTLLRVLIPRILIYVVSFAILGVYWVGHHNLFHYIKRTDRILLWVNLGFLMCVGLLPFSTVLLGRYDTLQAAVVVYGLNLMAVSLLLRVIWWYATNGGRLVDHDLDPHVVRLAARRIIVGPIIFVVGITASFVPGFGTWLSLFLYSLAAVFYIIPSHLDIHFSRRHVHD